MKMMIEK